MSETESFAAVIGRINCEIAEIDATNDRPFPYRLSSNVLRDLRDRLQAAHEREMHNPSHKYMQDERARYEHDLDMMSQYHRGYEDGRRSMDAEHALIAMRLKDVPLTDWGHENLNRIAYAIYPCSTGWTKESCKGLVDRLVHLLGGDGIEIDSLREYGSPDGVRSAAVSSGQEQVTFDVLESERHKAVRELRKLPDAYKGKKPTRRWYMELCDAIGVGYVTTFANVRDRLIHLLGGDQPTSSELYGIWKDSSDFANPDAESDGQFAKSGKNSEIGQDNGTDNGTCPNDVPIASITDELRRFMESPLLGHTSQGVHKEVLAGIADRIDEQFARCCELWERVATEQVLKRIEFENERDELREEVKSLKRAAERDADQMEALNLSLEEAQAELDRTKELLETSYAKRRALQTHIDQMQGGSKRLREEINELKGKLEMIGAIVNVEG